MKYNLTKSKVWQIIGVAVLCAVCVLTAVLGVVFGMNHSSEDLNVSKDMSNQDPLLIESTQEQGITILSGVATFASDNSLSKVLTATVDNEGAKVLPYSWSVAFKNASSSWAKGKNISDYVTVEKSSASDLQATVTCKQAFGEQIIVTVSSDYGSASASCTVDYKKRVLHNKITFACENTAYSFVLTDELSGDDYARVSDDFIIASKTEEQMPQYTITIEITFSDGTVTGEYHLTLQSGNSSVYTINSGKTIGFGEQFMSMEKFNLNEMVDIDLVYDGNLVCYWATSFCEPANSMTLDNTSIVF